ncbi:MAG: TIGR00282 family metallophosphoesterase [Balneolaceae bacterium]
MSDTAKPKKIHLLFIADIVGEPGLSLLEEALPGIMKQYNADFVIANAENSHEGRGLNREITETLFGLGVNVLTGGNHSFDKWKIFPYMREEHRLLRPLNYPKGNPGNGYGIYGIPETTLQIGVLNLQGRTFMQAIDDPFPAATWALERIQEETNLIFIDFHAEATAEKLALAWEIDGQASIMVGTHTHIPTNDARILPNGTGYITDAGMTGSFNSVIGMDKSAAIRRFTRVMPQKYKLAQGDERICGVYATIETESGRCTHIEPVIHPQFSNG